MSSPAIGKAPILSTFEASAFVIPTDAPESDGTIEWNPAGAAVIYTPKPDGTLTGSFHADISSGRCQGTVDMPIEAVPG